MSEQPPDRIYVSPHLRTIWLPGDERPGNTIEYRRVSLAHDEAQGEIEMAPAITKTWQEILDNAAAIYPAGPYAVAYSADALRLAYSKTSRPNSARAPQGEEVERIRGQVGSYAYFSVRDVRTLLRHSDSLAAALEKKDAALKPFAEYAPAHGTAIKDNYVITKGSPMAKRQLTIGDCRIARVALNGDGG